MSGSSIGFDEEVKKLRQNMCSVRMLIWRADCDNQNGIWFSALKHCNKKDINSKQ